MTAQNNHPLNLLLRSICFECNQQGFDVNPSEPLSFDQTVKISAIFKKCSEKNRGELVLALAEAKNSNPQFFPDPLFKTSCKGELPLIVTPSAHAEKGIRKSMEDAHVYLEKDSRILAAVFDGHGGAQVAQFVAKQCEQKFFKLVTLFYGNIQSAVNYFVEQVHNDVISDRKLDYMGTTAVICYIDKITHEIYIATVGDSEARLFRANKTKKLSLVEDWSSPHAMERLVNAGHYSGDFAKDVLKNPHLYNTKEIRYRGLNVSNAIGDKWATGTEEFPVVTHYPNITKYNLKAKDIIVIGCDGLWDFIKDHEILQVFKVSQVFSAHITNPAKVLVDYALNTKFSMDNVSVIVLEVHSPSSNGFHTLSN